jgi:hypothetical protein
MQREALDRLDEMVDAKGHEQTQNAQDSRAS